MNDVLDFRELFSVINDGEYTRVRFTPETQVDVFNVALCVVQTLFEKPVLACMFNDLLGMMTDDPDFRKKLEQYKVAIPDFDELLKNSKK